MLFWGAIVGNIWYIIDSDKSYYHINASYQNISLFIKSEVLTFPIVKNIVRHTAHTIVSWPNPKQWVIVHTSDLMMIIRQSIYSLPIITREMGCCHIIRWLYAWGVGWFICSRFHIHPGKLGLLLLSLCSLMMCANNRLHYGRWSHPFVCTLHYLVIISMQTYLKVLNC